MNCPNLRDLFGAKYKITLDPAARKNSADPWYFQIPCGQSRITIYPYGDNTLAVECDNRKIVAKRLADAGFRLWQDGDNEKTFIFTVEQFKAVAKIVKPKRRRTANTAHLAAFQFKSSPSPVASA